MGYAATVYAIGVRRPKQAHIPIYNAYIVLLNCAKSKHEFVLQLKERTPMLPLGDDNSRRRLLPVVTYALIVINLLVFVLIELPSPDLDALIMAWGTVPSEIVAGRGLITLLTSMFLHGGWAHLGGNMLFLWIFGDNVEDALGYGLYLAFYLVSGLAASLAQVVLDTSSSIPGVGASGAISGVLAAYIVMFGSNRVRVLMGRVITSVPAYMMIGVWIALQFVNGVASLATTAQTGGVAYGAHIGGFIAGLILTFLLRGFMRLPPTAAGSSRRP